MKKRIKVSKSLKPKVSITIEEGKVKNIYIEVLGQVQQVKINA